MELGPKSGNYVFSKSLPWHYEMIWILITSPLTIIIFFLMMIFIAIIDIKFIYKYTYYFFILCLCLLFSVEIIGTLGKGAERWIKIFGFSIQPSEIIKVSIVLALAKFYHSIKFDNIATESPKHPNNSVSDFNWIDSDNMYTFDQSGVSKQNQIFHDGIKNINLNTDDLYIGFYVMTDNVWVGEDFLISDAVII